MVKIKKDWEKIGFVEGNGTATNPNSYSFIDNDVSAGSYSYRLKQIDFDGSFKYSKVIEANINLPAEFSLEQNYPNPFNPSTNIGFRIAEFGFVTLKIYDVLGKEVVTLVNKEMEPGNYNLKFDASNLTSGLYFYSLKTKGFYQVKKMMLVK